MKTHRSGHAVSVPLTQATAVTSAANLLLPQEVKFIIPRSLLKHVETKSSMQSPYPRLHVRASWETVFTISRL